MNDSKRTAGLISTDEPTKKFCKGFDVTILRNMRRFHIASPIQETVSLKLSWYHSKDFWCAPYSFDFLNLTDKHLLKANLDKKRMKRQAQLQHKTNGESHD